MFLMPFSGWVRILPLPKNCSVAFCWGGVRGGGLLVWQMQLLVMGPQDMSLHHQPDVPSGDINTGHSL